jgi:GAF domain
VLARIPGALRAIDEAQSLTQTLEALLQHAGAIAGRAALFVVNGDRLKALKAVEIPEIDVRTVESSIGARDLLGRAIQTGQPMFASPDLPAPPFARLAADRPAMATPLMIGGSAVAVLYADPGSANPPAEWTDAVDLVARHGAAVAGLRAAARTLDVLRGDTSGGTSNGNGNSEESARRYARLLVSEIKLYNEPAVRLGRQHRDLRKRLRAEIDRAQRMYEERVPPAVGGRDQVFHQELVQTLADGDPALLGS